MKVSAQIGTNSRRLAGLAIGFAGDATGGTATGDSAAVGQDVIGAMLQWFYDTAAHLRPTTFSFLLRAALLFGLPAALCYWSFLRGTRSLLVQWLWCLAGILIASIVPVRAITIGHAAFKAWVVVLSLLLLGFKPAVLPNFLTPTLGAQRLLRVINYLGLAVLFVVNLTRH